MPDGFQLEMVVPAEPQRVFAAWMDAKEHAAFTGGGEAIVEPWAGGRFTSWEGYIHVIFLGVDAGKRIVQTWRTVEFPPEARDSRLVVEFDGGNHRERLTSDDRRQNRLIGAGYRILRFTAADIHARPEVVVAQVRGSLA